MTVNPDLTPRPTRVVVKCCQCPAYAKPNECVGIGQWDGAVWKYTYVCPPCAERMEREHAPAK